MKQEEDDDHDSSSIDDVKIGIAKPSWYNNNGGSHEEDEEDEFVPRSQRKQQQQQQQQGMMRSSIASTEDIGTNEECKKPPAVSKTPPLLPPTAPFNNVVVASSTNNDDDDDDDDKVLQEEDKVLQDKVQQHSSSEDVVGSIDSTIGQLQLLPRRASTSSILSQKDAASIGGGSNLPGAKYVPRIAPGLNYDSVMVRQHSMRLQQRQQQHQPNANDDFVVVVMNATTNTTVPPISPIPLPTPEMSRNTLAEQFQQQNKRNTRCVHGLVTAVAVCIVVGAALALGVVFGVVKKQDDTAHQPIIPPSSSSLLLPPFIVDCNNLHNQASPPDAITQCQCAGTISMVTSNVYARYTDLMTNYPFIRAAFSTTGTTHNETIDSCSPHNQALVWLSSNNDNVDGVVISESKLQQRFELALVFLLWNGPRWNSTNGWLSSHDECQWYGITCNDNNGGMVTTLSLGNNTLSGKLEPALSFLTNLTALLLNGNDFHGSTLPSSQLMGQMTHLQTLQLASTGIHGIIPTEIGRCTNLYNVELDQNYIHGTIPSQVGLLAVLESWNVSQNNLTGTIPMELWNDCTNLTMLDVGHNQLHGTIPRSVGNLTALEYLILENNNFSGRIPSDVGRCSHLLEFRVAFNDLNGTVPNELAAFTMIDVFDISENQLSGGAPEEICQRFNDVHGRYFICSGCICPDGSFLL